MQDASSSQQRQSEWLDPARASALNATLGIDDTVQPGDPLPPFYHQLYFWTALPPDGLGRDGHPRVGGLIPDLGLPRRMWAGGRLRFDHPLRAGDRAEKQTFVDGVQRKTGRSGPLGFVTLRHEFRQDGTLCVTEWQDLVYRPEADPKAPPPHPQSAPPGAGEAVRFDTTMLFRYSALTFNGHRIHYDETYARQTEGYDGLVVHGPLLAQLLMLKAAREVGPLTTFRFRGHSPLVHHEAAQICRDGSDLWVAGPDGRLVMQASA